MADQFRECLTIYIVNRRTYHGLVLIIFSGQLFLNQAYTWFLETAFVREVSMHVWMCVSAPNAMNNLWHDMKPE